MRILKNRLTSILVGASLLTLTPAFGQGNEDEWYDPTDWFDGNNYEYDDTLGLDYSYYDDEIGSSWTQDSYGYNYDYDYGYEWGDNNYGYNYEDEWGYNDEDWGLDNDWNENEWGYEDEEAYGGYGESEEGFDWGFSRGYGPQSNSNSSSDSSQRTSQMSSDRQNRQVSQSSQGRQQQKQQKQQKQVSGTLERVRTLTMRDNNDNKATKLTVAQVELQQGRDVLVAFKAHPDQRQQRIQLKPGNRLQAKGKVGVINGRRVLMADQIRSNGRTFDVRQISTQSLQGTGSAARFQRGGSQQPERGRVQSTRSYRSSSGDEHTLLLIQFENGRTALVDLGPNAQF